MSDFKTGDVAVCVEGADGSLTVGEHYEVRDVGEDFIQVRDDTGYVRWWFPERFVKAPASSEERAATPAADMVHRPPHYSRFVIEPITFINANKLSYNIGNVVKYACRYDAKNGLEDLKKARRYLDIQIECMERDQRVLEGEDAAVVWSKIL